MHPNPIFRKTDHAKSLDLVRKISFGALLTQGEDLPHVAHIPFLMDEASETIELHLVRSNPIARQLTTGERPAKLIINGPHSYISPDWYGIEDQVPTWNYVAVHLTGTLSLMPQSDLHVVLERLSEAFEQRLTPKPVWKMDKLTESSKEKLMRQIVPCLFHISQIDSTWKLGQNKPEDARMGAAEGLKTYRLGVETETLSNWMKTVPL